MTTARRCRGPKQPPGTVAPPAVAAVALSRSAQVRKERLEIKIVWGTLSSNEVAAETKHTRDEGENSESGRGRGKAAICVKLGQDRRAGRVVCVCAPPGDLEHDISHGGAETLEKLRGNPKYTGYLDCQLKCPCNRTFPPSPYLPAPPARREIN